MTELCDLWRRHPILIDMFFKEKERKSSIDAKGIHVSSSGLMVGWNLLIIVLLVMGSLYVANQFAPVNQRLDRLRRDLNGHKVEIDALKIYKENNAIREAERNTDIKNRIEIVEARIGTLLKTIIEEDCLKH